MQNNFKTYQVYLTILKTEINYLGKFDGKTFSLKVMKENR